MDLLKVAAGVRDHWARKQTAWVACAAAAVAAWMWAPAVDPHLAGTQGRMIASTIGVLVALAAWTVTNRVPRAKPGRIGIAVALYSEDVAAEKRVAADFVAALRSEIARHPGPYGTDLCVIPAHVARGIAGLDEADKFRRRCRCHLILFGSARRRTLAGGADGWVLSLEGAVVHAPTDQVRHERLVRDFRQAVPKTTAFADAGSVFEFESTADSLGIAARYVLARAAALSGDLLYALDQLDYCQRAATSLGRGVRRELRQLLSIQVPEFTVALLGRVVQTWARPGHSAYDPDALRAIEPLCDRLLALVNDHPAACNAKAVAAFVLRRDVARAKAVLCQSRSPRDALWYANMAFLKAYCGEYVAAAADFRRSARRNANDPGLALRCEEFMQDVLFAEPGAWRVLAASVMVNAIVKKDEVAARSDFQRYVAAGGLRHDRRGAQFIEQLATAMREAMAEYL